MMGSEGQRSGSFRFRKVIGETPFTTFAADVLTEIGIFEMSGWIISRIKEEKLCKLRNVSGALAPC